MSPAKKGFTFAELIVTLAIIATLIGCLVPAVQSAREQARREQCRDHMKQVALALLSYHDTHLVFPPGWLAQTACIKPQFGGIGLPIIAAIDIDISGAAWGAFLLPFCGLKSEQSGINFDLPMTASITNPGGGNNRTAIQRPIALFRCPSDEGDVDSVQSTRGCGAKCTQTSQGGTAPPKSIGGVWEGRLPKVEWVDGRILEISKPETELRSTVVVYPVSGDLSERTAPAAISNYLGNSGAYMVDGQVADIDWYVQQGHAGSTPPPLDFGGVMFERSRVRIQDITDGKSNTALIAEHTGATCINNASLMVNGGTACFAWWANADSFVGDKNKTTVASDVVFSSANGVNGSNNVRPGTGTAVGIPGDISSLHPGGANVAMCDGAARFFTSAIDAAVLKYVCVRNDGHPLSLAD